MKDNTPIRPPEPNEIAAKREFMPLQVVESIKAVGAMNIAGKGQSLVVDEIFDLFKFNDPDALDKAKALLSCYSQSQVRAINKPDLIRFDLNDSRLDHAANTIYEGIARNGWRKEEECRRFINCLLSNFVHNIAYKQPVPTAVSTKHSLWGKQFSVEMQKKILDALVVHGYVHRIMGSQEDKIATSYIPTLKATHTINSEFLDPSLLVTRKPRLDEITLNRGDKGGGKVVMSARNFPEVTKYRKTLRRINEHIQQFPFMLTVRTALPTEIVSKACDGWIERNNLLKVLLPAPDTYSLGAGYSYEVPLNTVLKRSFNLMDGEALGGRFFGKGPGHYLGLPKEIRKHDVLLYGEALPEPDLISAQFAILYGMCGLTVPENVYIYDKAIQPTERKVMKKLGVVVLNTTPKKFKDAVLGGLVEDVVNGNLDLEAVDWFNKKYPQLKVKFYEQNKPIEHMLGIGIVFRLMQIESKILERTMLSLIELNIPFLPIHDSIKVRSYDVDLVSNIFADSFASVVGHKVSISV